METTVNSTTADGKHHAITLKKTGGDTATVTDNAKSFKVGTIKAAADGSKLACKGPFGVSITVTVQPAAGGQMPIVRVDRPFGPDEFPVSNEDETKLKDFIKNCHFPAL